MVVERRAFARLVATRARLADIVEQGGEPGDTEVVGRRAVGDGWWADLLDHRDRVAEHVLVTVDRVVLEPQGRQLGEELLGQTGVHAEPQTGGRMFHHDQLVQLVADPLRGDDLQPGGAGRNGRCQAALRLEAEAGHEAGGAQHA